MLFIIFFRKNRGKGRKSILDGKIKKVIIIKGYLVKEC